MSILLKNVNLFYGSQQVLFNIDVNCPTGETLVLLGPSGAGKSSLLRIFNLLELPQTGELQASELSFNFKQPLPREQVRELRQNVGMVFQQYNLWPHMTVLENLIEAPIKLLKISRSQAIADAQQTLKRLQLQDFSDRYPLHLSGGQQQRVAIARALMMKPEILLFDEPTAALDPEITAQVAKIISDFAKTGITQIVVTHDVEFAKKIASRIIYMEQGHIIEQGDISHFTQPQSKAFALYLSH